MSTINTSSVFKVTESYSEIAAKAPCTGKKVRYSQPPPTAHPVPVGNRRRGHSCPLPAPLSFPIPPPTVAKELLVTLAKLDLTQLTGPHAGHFKSPRSISAGELNAVPNRQLSLELGEPLDASVSLRNTENVHARQICDAIADDALRRILLLYYQLLAYWKEGCQISLGQTLIQHGIATSPRCGGAHSALLPHLVDNHLEVLGNQIANMEINESLEARC